MTSVNVNDEEILQNIHKLVSICGGDPTSFEGELITQLVQNGLKLMIDGHDTGQLKLITRAIKEMRYAYRIFNQHIGKRRISIFGSARTPENHPDYLAAKEFGRLVAHNQWMSITGAAHGIMKASLEGSGLESSFGLSIRLPFEPTINSVIEGDPKLITFRYFFTRKLMFMSHSEACAVFPGGLGTMDEIYEILTLMQTGRSNIVPTVLLEGTIGSYWKNFEHYVDENLLRNKWINAADKSFYYIAKSPQDGVDHILKFYSRYHSSRYVKDILVIRMNSRLSPEQIKKLNEKFSVLIRSGTIYETPPLPDENDHLDLPRIAFEHTRLDFGIVRQLIDQINDF